MCSITQLCPTVCDPLDCSLPDYSSSVHGIFKSTIWERVAISSSRGSSWPMDQTCISCISCIGRQILYHCASWEAQLLLIQNDSHHHLWINPFPPWMQFLPWPYQTTLSSLNMFIASIRPCYLVWNVSCALVPAKNTIHPSNFIQSLSSYDFTFLIPY